MHDYGSSGYNLKELLNYKGSKSIAGAKTIKIKAKKSLFELIYLIHFVTAPPLKGVIAAAIRVIRGSDQPQCSNKIFIFFLT